MEKHKLTDKTGKRRQDKTRPENAAKKVAMIIIIIMTQSILP